MRVVLYECVLTLKQLFSEKPSVALSAVASVCHNFKIQIVVESPARLSPFCDNDLYFFFFNLSFYGFSWIASFGYIVAPYHIIINAFNLFVIEFVCFSRLCRGIPLFY